jgi:hypothetical protein
MLACFLFMKFALNEHPLAHFQLRPSKLSLPYQQQTALVFYSVKYFLANKSVPNVGKLTLSMFRAFDPVSLNLPQVFAPRRVLIFGALIERGNNGS